MKRKNNYLIALTGLLLSGQFLTNSASIESVHQTIKLKQTIVNSGKYFISNNELWVLKEIPKNASGVINPSGEEVTYTYERFDSEKWRKEHQTFQALEEKIAILNQPDELAGGADSLQPESLLKQTLQELSGKLVYGDYRESHETKTWFS